MDWRVVRTAVLLALLTRTLEAQTPQTGFLDRRVSLAGQSHHYQVFVPFSYTASHDLRAPLRSIAGHAQMLLRDLGERIDAGARDHLQRMGDSASRLDRLIHDLVVYTSIGRAKRNPCPISQPRSCSESKKVIRS